MFKLALCFLLLETLACIQTLTNLKKKKERKEN